MNEVDCLVDQVELVLQSSDARSHGDMDICQ